MRNSVQSDTLENTGSLSGYVALEPQHMMFLSSVQIYLVGTTRSVNADSSGYFTFTHLPAGLFTLRCLAPENIAGYSPRNKPVFRVDSRDTVLSDTLRIPL